ncbi:hypothetical protein MKW94_023504, partial [Papaver nudicaule]|nr:hypothetical protein [Papaver nudicaule]
MYSQGSQFRPNLHQGAASMHPPSQQGGGGGAPPPPPGPPPLQPPQFPSAPAPHLYHHGQPGPPRPLPGLAPPPWVTQSPSLHGQMSYGTTAARFPPPQHGQLLPPPLPGFVSSFVHSSYENPFETVPRPPSMLPPPPPPPPPPRDTTEDGNGYVKEDTGKDKGNLEVKGILPPPPRKPAEQEVVKKIEVLCHYIAKNGPAFEEVARAKQSGNPEFAFLIGGEPGSAAAIAHEYFQWMKSKCCMDLGRSDKTTSLPAPLEIEDASKSAQDPAPLEIEVASNSAQDSDMDMDMEDDMNESDRDQGVSDSVEGLKLPVSKSNEVSFVKEQSPEHPHLISGSEASGLAADGR